MLKNVSANLLNRNPDEKLKNNWTQFFKTTINLIERLCCAEVLAVGVNHPRVSIFSTVLEGFTAKSMFIRKFGERTRMLPSWFPLISFQQRFCRPQSLQQTQLEGLVTQFNLINVSIHSTLHKVLGCSNWLEKHTANSSLLRLFWAF